jgi:hypothetical protein
MLGLHLRHTSLTHSQHAVACEALKVTPYAKKVAVPADSEGWDEYVIQILKNLRSADKAGWHHRMTARVRSFLDEIYSG